MKVIETTMLIFAILFCVNYTDAQSDNFENSYVRIYVQDARTAQASSEIDLYMRAQNGVITSRMDKQTGFYLCIFKHDVLSTNQIKSWISSMGYSPSCQVSGIHGNGEKVKSLLKSDCLIESNKLIQK